MTSGSSEGRRGDLELGTIPRLVMRAADRFGGLAAVSDEGVTLTYADLAASVERAARALAALGVSAGDRVAIWAPNTWEWVVAALAVHAAGGALVPINTRFKGVEAAEVIAKSGARVLFTTVGFLGTDYVAMLRESGVALPRLGPIVVLRGAAPPGMVSWEELLARAGEVSRAAAQARALAVRPDDLSDILFTSGTTGRPKGVPCTHAQTLRAFLDWADTVGLRQGDRYLVVLPFFHSFGYKAGILTCLMAGATILPQAVFDAGVVLERIPRDRVSVLPGPPSLYQTLLARPDLAAHDLSSLRLAVTGAAHIPVELVHRMRKELGFETVITGYGLTETSGIVTMCHFDDDPETIAGTSGRAIPGVEVRVVGDDGQEVPRGAPGEVIVRGYNVMRGYHDDPEETAAVMDGQGFLRTGDVGVMDARGYLRITDRKKDMFIVGGFNAYPAEIERVLLGHEAVAQAAVVGVPDDRLGEVGRAFVVLRPDLAGAVQGEALVAYCRERMANYKVPRRVEIVDALPTNATGKVLKYALRAGASAAGKKTGGICEGRVVIVTGAGRGLGREHALAFARQGARVVVNDLGVSNRGEGRDAGPAREVVEAIRAMGGEAVEDGADVADWAQAKALVDAAIARFGRLDVVVNNAGFVRDRMFVSATEEEWDAVMRVHLRGHFCVSRHAAAHWRDEAKAGRTPDARIINTSSGAGLLGSVGQSAYSAAKAGIAALTLVQAAELGRYGITAHAIAPVARTRMTEAVFAETMKKPEEGFDAADPANVSPLVVWLGSPESKGVTGRIWEVSGGRISVMDGYREEAQIDAARRWDPAELGPRVRELLERARPAVEVYGA
jgi:acyl-CoA synthetase (AMP-forming)/AMP-acid ligase II/NAD(P)-dependent dehydrogenase (short-subunit alcohol dehydrogenase family)